MGSIIALNNARLQETPFPSTDYNKLPHIRTMSNAATEHSKEHAILLGIIAAHGLRGIFSLHLIHKHYDIPEGRFMVYENVQSTGHQDFVLCSPRLPEKYPNTRGLYFKAIAEGRMAAYEFTTEPGVDLSAHEDFVAKFSSAVIRLGVQDIFALTAMSICPENTVLTEFEMADALSTVLVPDASWLPAQDMAASTPTDWIATQDYEKHAEGPVSGTIQLKSLEARSKLGHYNIGCTETRSGNHYKLTKRTQLDTGDGLETLSTPGYYNIGCTETRSGNHYKLERSQFGTGDGPEDPILEINGEVLQRGSEPHAIVSHALSLVDAI